MKVSTTVLQALVSRAIKGSSMNKMLPITSLMAIELKDNVLTLSTTDGTNYLYVGERNVSGDDFYVVVDSDLFYKLVSKLTSESVSIDIDDSGLIIKGNGVYSLEIPLDEEGEMVRFPDKRFVGVNDDAEFGEIKLSTIKHILSVAKSALAQTNEVECYTGYYMGNSVITTDTYKICNVDVSVFDTPALLHAETVDLMGVFLEENIKYTRGSSFMHFVCGNDILYSPLMDCIEDFQVDSIMGFVNTEMNSKCGVSRAVLLQLLDRLSLFVSPYDRNGIYLTFTRQGLQVDCKKSNSTELIEYKTSEGFKDFTCCIDIEMFRSQVKSTIDDVLTICYGDESAIKIECGNVTQIVALLEDDR